MIGCGPVGLAVITMLKAAGVGTVIGSDMSPRRRELAGLCGADVVVNPQTSSPFTADPTPARATEVAGILSFPNIPWMSPADPQDMKLALDTMEKLREDSTVPWWQVFEDMHEFGTGPSGPVVFDCVGAVGLLDKLTADAPPLTRIVAIGSCMHEDKFQPTTPLLKEMDIRFSCGYNPGEFQHVLRMIAQGEIDPTPLVTGRVGLEGVDAAFDALDNPEKHAKILIDPQSSISTV